MAFVVAAAPSPLVEPARLVEPVLLAGPAIAVTRFP